jgi:hypothetical protein
MRPSATPTVLALSTALILGCMGNSDQERERKSVQFVQESRVDKALAVLGIEGPIDVEDTEGWWMGGVFHLRDGHGRRIIVPFGFFIGGAEGESWSFIEPDFLEKTSPEQAKRVECAWVVVLESWVLREFSADQVVDLGNFQGGRELSTSEQAALRILHLKMNPRLPDVDDCLDDDA